MDKWKPGWISQWYKDTAKQQNSNPADVSTWNVHYDDCKELWIMCHHKDSPSPILNLIGTLGRLPIKTRQYVRHIIHPPGGKNRWAYNASGNVAFFGTSMTLIPGGKCGPRLKNSKPVKISGVAMRIQAQILLDEKPDDSFLAETEVLPEVEYSTRNSCAEMFSKELDIQEADESEVEAMEDVEFSTGESDWEAFNHTLTIEGAETVTEEL